MINWNKLQPYKLAKQKSYEQLCFQIAFKLFEDSGTFSLIDDSGGGDGVEFYLTLPDGEQWGWQAKYYEGSPRLREHNRKQNIIASLKRAIEVHPNLKRWYLCLPMDLTPLEAEWIRNVLPSHVPNNRHVEVGEEYLWNESFIHEKLNQPRFNGLKQAFFNELELTSIWFKNAFNNSFKVVSNKFDELLYVPNEEFEFWSVNPILCNTKFLQERVEYYPKKLRELSESARDKIEALYGTKKEWQVIIKHYRSSYQNFDKIVSNLIPRIEVRYNKINPNEIYSITEDDFNNDIQKLTEILTKIKKLRIEWNQKYFPNVNEEENTALKEEYSNLLQRLSKGRKHFQKLY